MRVVKFRAWSKTSKKMLDRMLAGPGDPCSIVWDEEREEWVNFDAACGFIMQYTGLKDKNGKEIYEGDIILVADTKWTVAWHRHENGMTGWMVRDNEIHHWYVIDTSILRGKVIGNIYANPELERK